MDENVNIQFKRLCTCATKQLHTVIGNVGDLEAPGAVGLVGLEVNPEASGASREGDRPLVRLTRLVGGDGRGRPFQRCTESRTDQQSLH